MSFKGRQWYIVVELLFIPGLGTTAFIIYCFFEIIGYLNVIFKKNSKIIKVIIFNINNNDNYSFLKIVSHSPNIKY